MVLIREQRISIFPESASFHLRKRGYGKLKALLLTRKQTFGKDQPTQNDPASAASIKGKGAKRAGWDEERPPTCHCGGLDWVFFRHPDLQTSSLQPTDFSSLSPINLDAVGRPGGDTAAEEILILGPDRQVQRQR